MNRVRLALLATFLTVVAAGTAHADPPIITFRDLLNHAGGGIVVPPDWDGEWLVDDSTYTCAGVPTGTSTHLDTLCAGQTYEDPPPGIEFDFDCTGTATSTTVDVTCTGSNEFIPDCTQTLVVHTVGTRTAGSYRIETTINVSYSGTAFGCNLIPASCTRTVSYGTRQGPAPADYCATPTRPTSWGQLKTLYR